MDRGAGRPPVCSMKKTYIYNAIVRSVYDGDTIRVDIDLGFNNWIKNESLRLFGINTPEIRGNERERGLVSRSWLIEQIPEGSAITIQTFKDSKGKYGRYLAVIYKDGTNLNERMVVLGLAERYYP
jgi:micrococcal nuclease